MVEFLVVLIILFLLILIAFRALVENAKVAKVQGELTEMEQGARVTLDMIVKDILLAGYGMRIDGTTVDGVLPNVPPFNFDPDVNPNGIVTFRNDAITIRANTYDVCSDLADNMPQPSSEIKCEDVTGFVEGDWCIIFDQTGAWDIFVITNVQESDHLQHNPPPNYHEKFSKAYQVVDETRIVKISEIRYELDSDTGQIIRTVNGGDSYAVARNVEDLDFDYFEDAAPTVSFEPTTYDDRMRIRDVKVSIRTRTPNIDLGLKDHRRYTLSTRMSPRNLDMNGD